MKKPRTVRQYAEELTLNERLEIVSNYKQFQRDGFIGDVPMRNHAKVLMEEIGVSSGTVVLWMEKLVFECLMITFDSVYENKI